MNIKHAKTGTSLLAIGRGLAPVVIAGASFAVAAPAQAQTACLPIAGINILCTGGGAPADPLTPVLDLPPIAGPVVVTLGDGFQSPDTVVLSTVGAAADIVINPVGSAVINTTGERGLDLNAGGSITARITSITTSGNGATGGLLRAVDDVLFTADDLISTTGDNAPGLDIQGSNVTVNSNIIRTTGNNSNGVQLVSLDGPVNLDADLIDTSGNLSTATLIRSAGAVNVNVGVLRTQGSQALGLDIATNPATCVLLGTGGCDVTAAADQITTNGFGGIGALVTAATGTTTVNVDTLQTGGDEAAGLDLSADPVVCATLGAGACDQNFTVGSLTTQGDNSPGALIRAAGNITGNVNLLTTNGNNAAGLDLASDPDACILLGAGNCGTSFNIGQLTTTGDGSTGVLARIAGPTTGRIGVLGTTGDNATGIDIVGDPTACVLLGSGACDVDLAANRVTTQGDGAAGVLINAPANILANIGLISTSGDNATGLGITTDPAACLVLGPGSCGITAVTGPVTTGGDNSPGIEVVGGNDPISVTPGPVTTGGDNSPGVIVTGNGPITVVTTGPVTTTGNNSPAIDVNGGAGPVVVNTTAGPITTSGSNSDGIDVSTTTGNQTIVAGPIRVTGPGSDGIVAVSPGCSAINITATGAVTSAQGVGILASSACSVTVTTLPGAPVSGRLAGIDVTSGTGATITVGDVVSSATGPAIDVDGAPALVTITSTGTVNGYVDLTDSNDVLTNNGRFNATANSAFGAGADRVVNRGIFNVRPGAATAGTITLAGLENFDNSGLVDLRNGVSGDTLALPGNFTGSGASTLGLDVALGGATPTADRLVLGGAATGSTTILVNPLTANPGLLVNNLVLVDAGAGSSATAFNLGGPSTIGLVSYRLAYDPASSNYALFGTPSNRAYEFLKADEGARQIFYRTNDAWSGHMRDLRDAGGAAADESRRGSALWGQMFGSFNRNRSSQSTNVFGQAQDIVTNNLQDFFGGQIGYDFGGVSEGRGFVFGLTGGYANSTVTFSGNADRFVYNAVNAGAYASGNVGPVFLNVLGKYEHYWLDIVMPGIASRQHVKGDGYGGKAEAGLRFGGSGFFVEPGVSIEYVRTNLGTLRVDPTTIDFDGSDGLRGAAGLRIGTVMTSGATRTSLYAGGSAVHEFKGQRGLDFANGGQTVGLRNDRIGTYGHGVIGVNIVSNGNVSGFIEASGDLSKTYKGGGGRAGLSIRF